MNKNSCISIRNPLKFVPKGPFYNTWALVQVMAWHRTGDKPLPELMLTQFSDAYMLHYREIMMTSWNGNIFRVTGHLCGEFTGPGEFPAQRPVTRSFGVFFDLRLNKRLDKQSWGWWFEKPSRPLWRHRNDELTDFQLHVQVIVRGCNYSPMPKHEWSWVLRRPRLETAIW